MVCGGQDSLGIQRRPGGRGGATTGRGTSAQRGLPRAPHNTGSRLMRIRWRRHLLCGSNAREDLHRRDMLMLIGSA